MRKLVVDVMPGDYAVVLLAADAPVPERLWKLDGLVSVTRTSNGLSIVCPAEDTPPAAERTEPGWRLLTVRGPLEFSLTGIMAALSGALAAAGVALFALSAFDTDHVLVRQVDLERAVAALRDAGHEVHD